MRIGTKSVLFGVHCFLLHPLFIAIGWWQEYGWSAVRVGVRWMESPWEIGGVMQPVYTSLRDPRLWVAFLVHDIGYLGKPNMDGPEGETHPELGARIMRWLFGDVWGDFCLTHSRYYAKRLGRDVSPLCAADKRVFTIEPAWLYLPRARASGELDEFIANGQHRAMRNDEPFTPEERADLLSGDPWRWHRAVTVYMTRWLAETRGGKPDTWTPARHA